MTRENVKMNMDIISAFAEGKTIQYKTVTGVWCDLTESEGLPMGTLEEEPNNFRVKPEPKYRPFANAEECWTEMQKHQPFGLMKRQLNLFLIVHIDDNSIGYGNACNAIMHSKFDDVLKGFTFADGVPFGVKNEED